MAKKYGFDISVPASNAKEAVQWTYFGYLGAIKQQNGAAMSLGRTSTFLDIYFERDLRNGKFTYDNEIDKVCFVIDRDPQNLSEKQLDDFINNCKNNNYEVYLSNPTFDGLKPVFCKKAGINSPIIVKITTINIHFFVCLPFNIILIIDAGRPTIQAITKPRQIYNIK